MTASAPVAGGDARYRGALTGLVDVLEPDGSGGWNGRALYRGRAWGRFRMTRR